MKIEDVDFTPNWYWSIDTLTVSTDECKFFGEKWPNPFMDSEYDGPAKKYMSQVDTYYERFGNHMPNSLRSCSLRELEHV